MTLAEFKRLLEGESAPEGWTYQLKALWYDAKGDWEKSHEGVQDVNGKDAAWIHGYLHRKEGDLSNAQYWYARAGRSMPDISLEEEWEGMVSHFLKGV